VPTFAFLPPGQQDRSSFMMTVEAHPFDAQSSRCLRRRSETRGLPMLGKSA
jgi:hypothetical protein